MVLQRIQLARSPHIEKVKWKSLVHFSFRKPDLQLLSVLSAGEQSDFQVGGFHFYLDISSLTVFV